jgi:hypothetical protein
MKYNYIIIKSIIHSEQHLITIEEKSIYFRSQKYILSYLKSIYFYGARVYTFIY